MAAYISAIFLIIMWVVVTIATIGRYFFNKPLAWNVEFSEYTLLLVTFLSAAWILKNDGHVRLEIIISKLHSSKRIILDIISLILILIISIVLLIYGIKVSYNYYLSGILTEGMILIPRFIIIMIIPLSSILLIIQALKMIFKIEKNKLEKSN